MSLVKKRENQAVHVERTAPRKKELTDEQLTAKAASRRAKKIRQKERRAKPRPASALRARPSARSPRARSYARNIQYVMDGLRSAAARARSQAGSKTRVTYSLPPERDDGYRRGPSVVCATVPQGTVATGPSPRTGSRTSWPGAARLMRHAATKWLCT